MKKSIQLAISLVLLLGVAMTTCATVQAVEPRYAAITSLSSTLKISSTGAATCKGDVELWDGYTVDLKVELRQDGVTIKTWTDSGSGKVNAGGTYFVTSGHNYLVVTTATIHDNDGNWIESPSKNSAVVSY